MPSPPAAPAAGIARLLDIDPDLAAGLPSELFARLQPRIKVNTLTIPPGEWSPASTEATSEADTILVTSGLIVRDIVLAEVTCGEILGPGDVIQHGRGPELMLPLDVRFTLQEQTTVALLDRHFVTLLPTWPGLAARLLARVAEQAARQAVMRSISQLPRVDLRLVAVLWHLADRWGHVRSSDVIVPLPITHEGLGRLIGARRPTVSLALKQLADTGDVTRRADGTWVLSRDSLRSFASTGSPPHLLPLRAPATLPDMRDPVSGHDGAQAV